MQAGLLPRMTSQGSNAPSFQKSLSIFERRQSLGSNNGGSFEIPPGFRTSLNIFEDGAERNPLLPSYFRGDDVVTIHRFDQSNDLKREFVFSLKRTEVKEGASLSIEQIICFQARIRGYVERKLLKRSTACIVKLQSVGRAFLKRRRYQTMVAAIVRCQSVVRRHTVQLEARRLYDIKNPPRIRKLLNQIAAIQLKLDIINEQREITRRERERRKAQIKKECLERFAKEERDKALGIAHVQKSGSQLIAYFQGENNALRHTMKELAEDIENMRSENKALECDNQVVAQYTRQLHAHYKNMKDTNGSLQKKVAKLRKQYKPKWENAIAERNNYAINEARQKYVYRQGLYRIVDNVLSDHSCDSDFKDDIARVVGRCENEFDCELDIDTPLQLYPTPPEQQSTLSAFFKSEDEKALANDEEDETFEFINDADFLLPELTSFHIRADSNGGNINDDSDTLFQAPSETSSDSSSSTDSSDDSSAMSDRSFISNQIDADPQDSIEEYFKQNNAVAISPIVKNRNHETSSTVCSTDESDYEVKSSIGEGERCGVNTEVDSDSESGTTSSRPPWESRGETIDSPSVPTVVSIPITKPEFGEAAQAANDAYTLASTTCTTAVESESSCSCADFEVGGPPYGGLDYPSLTSTLEPIETVFLEIVRDDSGKIDQSSDHGKESSVDTQTTKAPVIKSLPTRKPSGKIEPKTAPKSENDQGQKETDQNKQRFQARGAPTRSPPRIPVRTRHPSTKSPAVSPFQKQKLFHARPAPIFGSPKIKVRDRNPEKLRLQSPFKARPFPKFPPPKIPVRCCNPT